MSKLRALAGIGAALLLSLPLLASPANAADPLPPVPSVDVQRYVGHWNQLASIPQIYTWQCASNTTADYAIVDADTISVVNTCRQWWWAPSKITGTADVLDTTTNAQLKVKFPFVPDFSGPTTPNYVITYLADDYSWALVGDPQRRSGFLLARGVSLTAAQWSAVRQVIESRGYDSCKFVTTPTAGGRLDYKKLCQL